MTTDLIPVRPDNPFPLGRAGVHHDPRNRQFMALVAPPPRRKRPAFVWPTHRVFDQGSESSCTAQAAVGLLVTWPFRPMFSEVADFDDPTERYSLYREAQRHDPWEGENYEGSSTDAPFRVLRDRGVITSWRWAFGEEQVRELVQWYCPVAVGTLWTVDMFNPVGGYIAPTGPPAGGHAYRLIGFSEKRQAYRIVNSWGYAWGQRGRAWIKAEHVRQLLADGGEAVTIGV